MKNKIIIIGFVVFLLIVATLGVVQSRQAKYKVDKIEKNTSHEKLDSIIQHKIDKQIKIIKDTIYDSETN